MVPMKQPASSSTGLSAEAIQPVSPHVPQQLPTYWRELWLERVMTEAIGFAYHKARPESILDAQYERASTTRNCLDSRVQRRRVYRGVIESVIGQRYTNGIT